MDSKVILAVAPTCHNVDGLLNVLNKWFPVYRIDTPLRQAAFLAQYAIESADFNRFVENTNYTNASRLYQMFPKHFQTLAIAKQYAGKPVAIANRLYANRYGNGDEASGDGYRYRGRGLCGLTFKNNYIAFHSALAGSVGDVVNHPELVETLEVAVLAGCWYWSSHNLNALADQGGAAFSQITRVINGGLIEEAERESKYTAACDALGV